LPANASRGKNVLRSSKKVNMTPADHINQQAVASYVREDIRPGNKMLPNSWSMWRDDKKFVSDDTKQGYITSVSRWKVILGGNNTSNYK
jgi:hypothetical protein